MRKHAKRIHVLISLDPKINKEFTNAIPFYQKSRYIEDFIREFLENKKKKSQSDQAKGDVSF